MRRTAALIALLALAVACTGCNPLNNDELAREVTMSGSIAAEGALLAEQVAEDRTKATFVRVHAGELAAAADGSAEKLNDAGVEPDLQDKVDAAIAIDEDVSGALSDLEVAPGDESEGARAEATLKRAADRASRLEESL
jgi:hypothetical protein